MRNRPRPEFLRKMHKEQPNETDTALLIAIYDDGGVNTFEEHVLPKMGNMPVDQIYHTDPYTREVVKWVYCGDFWWVRRREFGIEETDSKQGYRKIKKVSYEFARMVAIENKKDATDNIICGLWDSAVHELKPEPILVNSTIDVEQKGVVVGYNEFELLVEWINKDGSRRQAVAVKDLCGVEFEFVEDEKKFSKIFKRK